MKGDTHYTGGLLVKDILRMPFCVFYLMIKPDLVHALLIYLVYGSLTTYPASFGSVLPDYDANSFDNIPILFTYRQNEILWKFLKKIGAKHRSSHTHNIDIWGLLIGVPAFLCLGMFLNTKEDIWYLVFVFIIVHLLAILSHIFLDMLTVRGVNLYAFKSIWLKFKYKNENQYKHFMIKMRKRIVPFKRKMYKVKFYRLFGIKTPLFKIVETHYDETGWKSTEDGWESEIERRMGKERLKHRKISQILFEIVCIVLVWIAF